MTIATENIEVNVTSSMTIDEVVAAVETALEAHADAEKLDVSTEADRGRGPRFYLRHIPCTITFRDDGKGLLLCLISKALNRRAVTYRPRNYAWIDGAEATAVLYYVSLGKELVMEAVDPREP